MKCKLSWNKTLNGGYDVEYLGYCIQVSNTDTILGTWCWSIFGYDRGYSLKDGEATNHLDAKLNAEKALKGIVGIIMSKLGG